MSVPAKWWWGFIPLVLLWIVSTFIVSKTINADLLARASKITAPFGLATTVAGRDVRVSGVIASEPQTRTIRRPLRAEWGVRKVKSYFDVYNFTARKTADTLTLTGHVPSEAARKQIVDAARRLFGGYKIDDQLKITANALERFTDAALAGLGALSRLAQGELSIVGSNGTLSGEAFYQQALNAIRDTLTKSLPNGITVDVKASVRPTGPSIDAAACQTQVNALLGKTTILFETGSANISSDSAGLLDRIVGTFARCAQAKVEVAGHTDSTGDAAANTVLSQQRAEAVLKYLVAAGLPAANFNARGYGPTKPVASNDTEEGRTQNRRTEFVVQ